MPGTEPLTWAVARDRVGDGLRVLVLFLVGAAPLALGAVHEWSFVPLLALSGLAGLVSWQRARRSRGRHEAARIPGAVLLLALHAYVLLQLVPLPPGTLRLLSPGSFAYYDGVSLIPLAAWRPVSVNPADSARGLAFLAGLSGLYAATVREFQDPRWRRRLAVTIVGAGLVLTGVALVQAASSRPLWIYGVWRPRWDWAVFGPYVNRNHFAGYLVLAIPLAFGFAAEALLMLRRDWLSRRVGWLSLGGPAAAAALGRSALVLALVVGLLASRSRGGLLGFGASVLILPLVLPRRRHFFAVLLVVVALGLAFVDFGETLRAFQARGVRGSRVEIWQDAARLWPRFPVFGVGFNAFSSAYPMVQNVWRTEWIGEAHNEYLQVLLELGLAGAPIVAALLLTLFTRAWRAAQRGVLEAGMLGSLIALAAHNLVDFNWQIPANAAAFVALAGLVVLDPPRRRP